MKKNNRISKWYVKYIIKSSSLYFSYIIIGLTLILILCSQIKLDKIEQFPVNLINQNGQYLIQTNNLLLNDKTSFLYLYSDKNNKVYKITNFLIEDKRLYFNATENSKIHELLNSSSDEIIYAEIPSCKISLLQKIFIHGGTQ